jgi:hypothetical protein
MRWRMTLSASEGDVQDVKANDAVKVPGIGCSDLPSGTYGGSGDEPVVCPDVLAGSREFSPDARMRPGVSTRASPESGNQGEALRKGLSVAGRPARR